MNTNSRRLALTAVVFALSVPPLLAGNDGKKKEAPPAPPAARPQQSSAPKAAVTAPVAQPVNRPGPAAGATHGQPGGTTSGKAGEVAHSQPAGATTGAAAGAHAQPSAAASKSPAKPARSQASNAPAPGGPHGASHEQLQRRLSVRPSPQERLHAHESYRSERARFARHMEPFRFAPGHRLLLTRMRIVPGTYYFRRSAFYETFGWVTPPYVYAMYPRYGLWDAGFLAFALHHVADEQYALMIYHHWNDAEIQQWVRDTNGASAQNAELRAQVAAMNDRMSRLERSGVARDSSYVPPDAQDVALSPDAVDQLGTK